MGARHPRFVLVVLAALASCDGTRESVPVPVATSAGALDLDKDEWYPLGPTRIAKSQKASNFGLGPLVSVGRISRLAVNPRNTAQAWVGAAAGGVAFNPNVLLESWSDEGLGSVAVGAIAPDPRSCSVTGCDTVWVGTGENVIHRDSYYGIGVAVGRKAGSGRRHWKFFGSELFSGGSITSLIVDPTDSDVLYLSLSSGQITNSSQSPSLTAPSAPYGIYKSKNGGKTWYRVYPIAPSSARPTDLAMDAGTPGVLYAGFERLGIFRSTDFGETWLPFNSGLNVASNGAPINIALVKWINITAAMNGPASEVFAALHAGPPSGYLFTTNAEVPQVFRLEGGAWKAKGEPPQSPLGGVGSDQKLAAYTTYTHHIAVDPAVPGRITFAGLNLWLSTNFGSTWDPIGGAAHPDFHESVFSSAGLLTVSDGGFYILGAKSPDPTKPPPGPDQYQKGLSYIQFQTISVRRSDRFRIPPVVLGGTQDNGELRFHGPEVWDHICSGDASYTLIDELDPHILYNVGPGHCASSECAGVRRTLDGGADGGSFASVSKPAPAGWPSAWYPPLIQEGPSGGCPGTAVRAMFTGTDRLFRSCDQASSWSEVGDLYAKLGPPVSYPLIAVTSDVVTAIEVSAADGNDLYAGYYGGSVFATTNARTTANFRLAFDPKTYGLNGTITGLAAHPTNPHEVYLALSGPDGGAVFGSLDSGASWTNLTANLDALPINTLIIEPAAPYRLIIGRDDGVFQRPSGFEKGKWRTVGTGAPEGPVLSLVHDGSTLYAGTHARGMFVLGPPTIRPWSSNCLGCLPDHSPILPIPGPLPPSTSPGFADAPFFAYGLPRNANCSMRLLQGDQVCASGTSDGRGDSLLTDASGQLVTRASSGQMQHHAWACWNGRCAGDSGYSACLTAAVTSVELTCAGKVVTTPVVAASDRSVARRGLLALGLPDGFSGQGFIAVDVNLRNARGEERVLCSLSAAITAGMDGGALREALRDATNADPTCIAATVSAHLPTGGGGEDAEASPNLEFLVATPGLVVVPHARFQAPGLSAGIQGISDGTLATLVTPTMEIVVPASPQGQVGGAAGGTLTVTASTFDGPCTLAVPIAAGEPAPVIATHIAEAFAAPGSQCPLASLRGLAFVRRADNATELSFRGALAVYVTSSDPSMTVVLGSRGSTLQPVPPQSPPSVQLYTTPLPGITTTAVGKLKLRAGARLALWAHSKAGSAFHLHDAQVEWKAADKRVVDISAGRITALAAGTTTMTAQVGLAAQTVEVEVVP